ncbi:MAG: PEGA domain-containing protein [Methanoregula sp.]
MKKTNMRLIIFVMVAFILLPVSVIGQDTTNTTVIPTTTGAGEVIVTTQVTAEMTTTMPVTNATQIPTVTTTTIPIPTTTTVQSNTTPLQGTTTVTVSVMTTTTGIPTTLPVTQASTGNITVASSPLGASILIDGVYYGTTVGNITGLPAGNHIVRLTMSGYYDYEGTLYVVPGQVTHVFGTLPPLSGIAPQITQPVTPAPVTTILPTITLLPTQASSGGVFDSPTVIAAVIGIITACIGAGVTLFTHNAKMKKE